MVVARGSGKRMWSHRLMYMEFQFCKMRKSSGDLWHNNANIPNTIELYA